MTEQAARALSRFNHLKWSGGGKANIIICGDNPISTSECTICMHCGRQIYFDTCCTDIHSKNAIFVCKRCALAKYPDIITPEMRNIIDTEIRG